MPKSETSMSRLAMTLCWTSTDFTCTGESGNDQKSSCRRGSTTTTRSHWQSMARNETLWVGYPSMAASEFVLEKRLLKSTSRLWRRIWPSISTSIWSRATEIQTESGFPSANSARVNPQKSWLSSVWKTNYLLWPSPLIVRLLNEQMFKKQSKYWN